MNFDCVGRKKDGEMYMKFHKPFNPTEKIQLLQRSILVQSFAYYELNENLLSDFQYDDNAKQLIALIKKHPEEFEQSRYYEYFYDYCPEDENTHYTSGYDLLVRVRKNDPELYRYLHMDAANALVQKRLRGVEET